MALGWQSQKHRLYLYKESRGNMLGADSLEMVLPTVLCPCKDGYGATQPAAWPETSPATLTWALSSFCVSWYICMAQHSMDLPFRFVVLHDILLSHWSTASNSNIDRSGSPMITRESSHDHIRMQWEQLNPNPSSLWLNQEVALFLTCFRYCSLLQI